MLPPFRLQPSRLYEVALDNKFLIIVSNSPATEAVNIVREHDRNKLVDHVNAFFSIPVAKLAATSLEICHVKSGRARFVERVKPVKDEIQPVAILCDEAPDTKRLRFFVNSAL